MLAAGQRVLLGNRQQEGLFEQELGVQLVIVQRQCQQGSIELALAQPGQQLIALFLDQQQFQLRETLADVGDRSGWTGWAG